MHLFSFFLEKGQLPKKLPLYTLLYMTIDDFLTEIDENQVKRIEPPHSKVEITSEEKSEKEIKEEPLTIENLSLFDDFKES